MGMEIGGGDQKAVPERKQASYQSLDDRFVIKYERYKGQQYSQIYFMRLQCMRSIIHALIPKWKPHVPVCSVLDLEQGKECIVTGTIFKHMKLKPKILDEYSKERSVVPLVKPHNFVHLDDNLIMEDESGRVKLAGSVLVPSTFVTGIVMAVHGKETTDGSFLVQDVLIPDLPPQIQCPVLSEDKYVIFMSGLAVEQSSFNPLQFQLLIDHITGHLGDYKEQTMASKIVRLVIAGNSVEVPKGLLTNQVVGPKEQSKVFDPFKELDISLTQLAASVPVDIMPGANDPANFSLPQQPLNRCLFPGASLYNTFTSCTNPHMFDLGGVRFLGTSGQNVDDLDKYSFAEDRLEFLERTLRWRHVAPTAPNTLGCYPFTDRDPFLIEQCPHVYFCGNQDKYQSQIIEGAEGQRVRLICIPRFCDSGTAVMLNIRNLECHAICLSTDMGIER
ncbi:DNA polymerase delta small subunit [Wolffia australiana]